MRSLRTRVFVTVAVVLLAAISMSGLLSRRATLVEERQMQVVGSHRPPSTDEVAPPIQQAYESGGWRGVRDVMRGRSNDKESRLLAVDREGRVAAVSDDTLETVEVPAARPDGSISLITRAAGAVTRLELKGVPTFAVHDAAGREAGRVFLLPHGDEGLRLKPPFPPAWVITTVGTALVALLVTFALSGRILRPVSELTEAARRMREGDLDVRVRPAGDGEMAGLGRAFNDMAERLAQTERMKRQMVSDVAHELRSPLTNLRAGLESIQDGLAEPDPAHIDALHNETLLLQRLIGDLQDLALADSGGLALRIEPVDVEEVARRAIGRDTTEPRVELRVDSAAARVSADAGRLEQMLRNLLSNARRHTPAGGHIDVHATREGASVRVAVADTGCGIAAEHVPHVFDRFYRVDGSRDRTTGGAGLGLAIVRQLAEAQKGSVAVSSGGAGRGATFTIQLPTNATIPRFPTPQ